MPRAAARRIIVALDVPTRAAAVRLVRRLGRRAKMFKVGPRLFTSAGPEIVRWLVARSARVFLDLKFHDIPSVVADACAEAARLGASLLTVHTAGGPAMLRAARRALAKHGERRPRLLGITILTSLSARELKRIGLPGSVEQNVVRLARLAQASGCDGVIAAPSEVASIRRACGRNFLIVTPGIRASAGRAAADQARTATAAEAIRAGADYVVVGRAILKARSPARAFDALAAEMSGAPWTSVALDKRAFKPYY